MKSKINVLLSCLLLLSVTTLVISCGDDDEPNDEPTVPEVYFISYETELIQKFPSDDPANMTTFLDVAGFSGVGLAYDKASETVFFSDFYATEEGKIWSVNIDGTGLDDIATGLYEPYGIAVGGNKLYYTDEADLDDMGHIFSSNLDGTAADPVVTMEGAGFRAVALDPENDKMYFYEVQAEVLYMADMDGSNQEAILEGAYGYAIAVDTENGVIYFDDQNSNGGDGALMMDELDGTYPLTPVTVDNTASRIYGIAIDNENSKLYWSGRDTGAIYKSDLDGSNKITLKDGLSQPRGLFLK